MTGGASGIGRATALRLASEGATVVAADVNAELLTTLEAGVGAAGAVIPLVGDVGSEGGAELLVTEAVVLLGHLDVVVNAAGVLSFAHSHEHTVAEWDRVIGINLTGTFLVCRYALPHLLAQPAWRMQRWQRRRRRERGGRCQACGKFLLRAAPRR